jgi:predicted ester cyclase
MDNREVTYAFLEAFQAGDFDTAATYMADDFVFSGPTPEPISGAAWFGLSAALRAAFPDLSYNFRVVSVDGDVVATTTQLTGTHTGDLDLSRIGKMGIIPATGKSVSLPEEEGEAIVEDGKVVSLHIHSTPKGGIMGILSQLGVKLPQMAE